MGKDNKIWKLLLLLLVFCQCKPAIEPQKEHTPEKVNLIKKLKQKAQIDSIVEKSKVNERELYTETSYTIHSKNKKYKLKYGYYHGDLKANIEIDKQLPDSLKQEIGDSLSLRWYEEGRDSCAECRWLATVQTTSFLKNSKFQEKGIAKAYPVKANINTKESNIIWEQKDGTINYFRFWRVDLIGYQNVELKAHKVIVKNAALYLLSPNLKDTTCIFVSNALISRGDYSFRTKVLWGKYLLMERFFRTRFSWEYHFWVLNPFNNVFLRLPDLVDESSIQVKVNEKGITYPSFESMIRKEEIEAILK